MSVSTTSTSAAQAPTSRPVSPSPASASSARPMVMSPHLQIWRFTVTMAASITHRASGIALYSGSFLLALWLYAAVFNPGLYQGLSSILSSPIGLIILFGYSWALFFHMANGIRHLFWDIGHGFELATAKRTAWSCYIAATVLAVIVLVAGLAQTGGV